MTLRARMATLAATAVALAVIVAAVAAWLLTRSTLLAEVDRQLREQSPQLTVAGLNCRPGDLGCPTESGVSAADPPVVGMERRLHVAQAAVPLTVQVLDTEGQVDDLIPPNADEIPISDEAQAALGDVTAEPVLDTYEADGRRYRSITMPTPDGALMYSRPLDDVDDTLSRLGWMLSAGAVAGVGLAGAAGWWVARAGLRPVDRLSRTAEKVADSKDLSHRIPVDGQDEIARLGDSINTMLEELDTARTQQRQLVEDAGHELRTPLATLRTDVGLLLRAERHPDRSLGPAEREAVLANLESEVAALSDLVSEVVELARGDVDDEPVSDVNLRDLVDHAVERTGRVNPDVQARVSGPAVRARVRPATIERAIANLLRNALQVTPAGRAVDVTLSVAGQTAVVDVSDEGPGVAAADLPRIFDRFYRGDDARGRQGSGLGLAIVQQAMEQHGGSVEAVNRAGGGARFTLRLPVARGASTVPDISADS